jgi:hypothetical protein
VARTGTTGAYERVARHKNYMVLEAWESSSYENTVMYYVWDEICNKPFASNSNGKVSALYITLLFPPSPLAPTAER